MITLPTTTQILLGLPFIFALHELGHFVAARSFGMRVERFQVFFRPWFPLLEKQVGGTVYGLGWLPLGAYVKIAGLRMPGDTRQRRSPARPWEFCSRPVWLRRFV